MLFDNYIKIDIQGVNIEASFDVQTTDLIEPLNKRLRSILHLQHDPNRVLIESIPQILVSLHYRKSSRRIRLSKLYLSYKLFSYHSNTSLYNYPFFLLATNSNNIELLLITGSSSTLFFKLLLTP